MIRVFSFAITAGGFLGCITFVTCYWWVTRGSWRNTEAGRMLMVVYANLAALLLLVMANTLLGNWPGRTIVALVLYVTFAIEAWWPLRLLSKTQREARARRPMDD